MPFTRPSLQEIINRVESDAEALLTGRVALLQRAVIRVFARVIAASSHIMYGFLQKIAEVIMPDTAITEMLDRHAYIWGVSRKSATFANGPVLFLGVEGTIIPKESSVQSFLGNEYVTTVDAPIVNGVALVEVQSKVPGSELNIINSQPLTLIAPLAEINSTAYAGIFKLIYASLSGGNFSTGQVITNLTRTGEGIVVDDNGSNEMKLVIVEGDFLDGDSFNNGLGVSAIVNGTVVLDAGIVGGQEAESDQELRERILQRIQFQPSGGTKFDFERWAKEVVTMNGSIIGAWCFPANPGVGYATVVVKAAGLEPVPSSALLQDVQDYLDQRRPVTADIIVQPIVKVLVEFSISIAPNTSDLRERILKSLRELFLSESAPGQNMLISHIRNAIGNTGIFDYDITSIILTPGGSQSIGDIVVIGFDYLVLSSVNFASL